MLKKYLNFIFSTFEKGGAKALEVEVEGGVIGEPWFP
jgi:hypothetical protein